ncbi:hypothetical protein [uncultured Litoreibacter sp.]|uniref:hypothetical protein n=1 Tax=uncultured Litoreibacter sp. TaxID=1392394 RepID=UPI0026310D35|nr:hypothetical protein [uncultured Litoreibacter sp.]
MKRTFLASILSVSLAATSLTATTAPAQADEDVLKVIAGLVVLGAIANQVKQNKQSRQTVTRTYDSFGNGPRKHQHRSPVRQYKVAPQRCIRETWTHRGQREVYGARCMQRHANAQLPQKCLRQNKTNSGPRYFYAKRCLRNQGWRA